MSGPSEAAVQLLIYRRLGDDAVLGLRAAHDPANFEDPMDVSVRLGDIVEALRSETEWFAALGGSQEKRDGYTLGFYEAAFFLLRIFGGQL